MYLKEKLGPELEMAKSRGGGFTRVEPSGTQFIRSICKLTHTGRKQYAKGTLLTPKPLNKCLIILPHRRWACVQGFFGGELSGCRGSYGWPGGVVQTTRLVM